MYGYKKNKGEKALATKIPELKVQWDERKNRQSPAKPPPMPTLPSEPLALGDLFDDEDDDEVMDVLQLDSGDFADNGNGIL